MQDTSLKLTRASEESTYLDQELYQSAVGKLLYLSTRTRPDIAFAVSTAAKFTPKPTEQHWQAVKHILRYIAGTINFGLQSKLLEMNQLTNGFADADRAGDIDDQNSTPGYIFKVGGGPVRWRSRKQSCIALSTAEAYMSLTLAAQEAIWLNCLLPELQSCTEPL